MNTSKPALIAGLAFAFAALAGVVTGVALDRTLFRHRPPPPRGLIPTVRAIPGGSPEAIRAEGAEVMMLAAPPEVRNQVMRDLDFTEHQAARVDSIVRKQIAKVREISGRVRPQIDSALLETRQLLTAELTPAQREKIKTMRPRRPEDGGRRPPPRGGIGPASNDPGAPMGRRGDGFGPPGGGPPRDGPPADGFGPPPGYGPPGGPDGRRPPGGPPGGPPPRGGPPGGPPPGGPPGGGPPSASTSSSSGQSAAA